MERNEGTWLEMTLAQAFFKRLRKEEGAHDSLRTVEPCVIVSQLPRSAWKGMLTPPSQQVVGQVQVQRRLYCLGKLLFGVKFRRSIMALISVLVGPALVLGSRA